MAGLLPEAAAVAAPAAAATYPGAELYYTITPHPAQPLAGKKLKLKLFLANNGLAPIQKKGFIQIWTNYTGNGSLACGAVGDKKVKLPPLNPGQSKTIKVTLKAPETTGKGRLAVFFDSTCLTWNTVR